MAENIHTDVIIIGAGPVGLVSALDLSSRGINSVVVEQRRHREPPNVKCNHVASRTMERFRGLGIADEVRAAGLPADYPQDVAFRTSLTGIEFARIPIPASGQRRAGAVGPDVDWATPEPPHRINQTFLEPILEHRAALAPGTRILNEALFAEYEQTEEGVIARITDLDGENPRNVTGRYLIGADGGRSRVRKQMGAKFAGDPVLQRVQSTCIRARGLYEHMNTNEPRAWGYYVFNHTRLGHVYAIDGNDTFLVHTYLTEAEAEAGSVDRDAAIRAILGDEDLSYEVISKEDWTARRLLADSFRDRRVFLAGDSCHLWVPFAGFGMNAGIADGLNLTWLLGACLNGWADEEILDAYEAERLPITDQVSRFAMNHQQKLAKPELPKDLETPDAAGETARKAYGQAMYDLNVRQFAAAGLNFGYVYSESPIIMYDGEDAPGYTMGDFTPSTVPGCRAPHFWLEDGESLYDRFSQGYSLVSAVGSDCQPLVEVAEEMNVPLRVIEVDGSVLPDEYTKKLTLVRQDQHVAWRGDILPDDVRSFMDALCGRRRAYQSLPSDPATLWPANARR